MTGRPVSRRLILLLLAWICWCASPVFANEESARYLRNGIHYFKAGHYEKSRAYFIAVMSIGTQRELATAKAYLARREFRVYSRPPRPSRAVPSTEPSYRRDSEILPDNDYLAPERQRVTAESVEPSLRISGSLREDYAYRVSQPQQLTKLRTVGLLAGTGQIAEGISYKVSGRLWYNAVFDLTDHYPRAVADNERTDGMLRDTYVDISKGDWDIRAGKQQIVWGEAVGLFYADVVNAKDLREFVLPDFEFIRIPEWGTDAEYTRGNFHGELIWLPLPEMDKVGRPGAEFFPSLPVPPGVALVSNGEDKPSPTLENSEVGGRLSYRAGGWDLGVFHLRTWDKFPVYVTDVQPGVLQFTATHPRLTIDGATFSKEINEVVLKGEFVYYWKKYFQSTDLSVPGGILPKDYMEYLLGADHTFGDHFETTLQFSQRIIQNYESDLFQQKQIRNQIALWMRRPFLNDHLEPELLVNRDLTTTDLMLRPKIGFKFQNHWKWSVGVDVFDGPSDGIFGQFSNRDRVFSEIRFDF